MRLPGLYLIIAMMGASLVVWPSGSLMAQQQGATPKRDNWEVYTPLMPPYSVMGIVRLMGAIQSGRVYSKRQMAITYEYRSAVNDGLAGCPDTLDGDQAAWFVTTLDDQVHEVKFSRDENGVLVARPGTIMAGPYELKFKWGCFRDKIFLANLKGQSAAGQEACRTPIPYGYCDLNGLIFWQLPEWDGKFVSAEAAMAALEGAGAEAPGEEGPDTPQDTP